MSLLAQIAWAVAIVIVSFTGAMASYLLWAAVVGVIFEAIGLGGTWGIALGFPLALLTWPALAYLLHARIYCRARDAAEKKNKGDVCL